MQEFLARMQETLARLGLKSKRKCDIIEYNNKYLSYIIARGKMNNYLGEKIKDLRNKQILTQNQLTDKLNVSRQTVSNWEKGTCQPDCDSVLKLCKVLGTDPNCLYGHGQNQDEEACDIAQTIELEETACDIAQTIELEETACDVAPDAEPEETIGDIVQNIAQDEAAQEQVKPTETEECKPVKKKKIGRIIVTSIAIALLIFVGGVAAIPFFEPIGSTAQYFVSFYLSTADKMKTVATACLVAVIWLAVKLVGMIKTLKNNKENKHD